MYFESEILTRRTQPPRNDDGGDYNGRCGARFESKKLAAGTVINNIKSMVAHSLANHQFKVAPSPEELQLLQWYGFSLKFSSKQLKLIQWIPPILHYCLNVDGASKGNPGDCGGGGCIRDRKGFVLVAFAHFYGPGNSMIAEIRALSDGLRLAENLGIQISMVHSDSLALVNSFKSGKCPSWQAYRWWRVAEVLIHRNKFLLNHVYRETNQVADSLANYGVSSKNNEEEEIDSNALDDQVVEWEVESDEEEEWTNDEDEEDDEDDAELDISSASDDEYR
ncbi:hypothetical protein Taro_046390 [Colocasia esculenta]|uniref:RNase H type-1 domain-containing protein n=1 Tax=Colocasia esculenta TaxID=4460 RepID=A0A843X5I1_COLES|nr:hypothetical protein [Colocasia esculenta]